MKQKRIFLNILFAEYCKIIGAEIDHSKMINGKYTVAPANTFFMHTSGSRYVTSWAIIRNTGDGCISIVYGYEPIDNLIGYLNGYIAARREKTDDSI